MTTNAPQPSESEPASLKPLAELTDIELLVWISRWASLENRFYPHDLDTLYSIKRDTITELIKSGELAPIAVTRDQSLIKFQSTNHSAVEFHVPYGRCKKWKLAVSNLSFD